MGLEPDSGVQSKSGLPPTLLLASKNLKAPNKGASGVIDRRPSMILGFRWQAKLPLHFIKSSFISLEMDSTELLQNTVFNGSLHLHYPFGVEA
jgi:hypothetical protein